MEIMISTLADGSSISIPINFIFWAFLIAYIIHIIDEALLGETFVTMVRKNYMPGYSWKKFTIFNGALIGLITVSIITYEMLGESSIVLPLIFIFLLTTNGLWHLIATTLTKTYSPGLLTSVIYWVLFYILVKYAFLSGKIETDYIIASAVIGTLMTIIMIGSLILPGKTKASTPEYQEVSSRI